MIYQIKKTTNVFNSGAYKICSTNCPLYTHINTKTKNDVLDISRVHFLHFNLDIDSYIIV